MTPYDANLVRLLADNLAMETGHTWRLHHSIRLRGLARHDKRMGGEKCATCTLLAEVEAEAPDHSAWSPCGLVYENFLGNKIACTKRADHKLGKGAGDDLHSWEEGE